MDWFLNFLDVLKPDQWGAIGALSGVVGTLLAIALATFGMVRGIRSWRERRYAKAFLAGFEPESIRNRRKVFGRDTEVAELRASLLESGKSAVVPVQTGGGGVGKTTLCKHYALVHKADYDHIEFLRASSETELATDLAALAKRYEPTLDDAEGTRPLAIRGRDMIEARAAKENWLVIFDNVETPQLMLDWPVQARHLHVLVTSRFPDWQAEGFAAKPLGVLKPDAALDVLKNESGRDEDGFADLAKDLGYLPLALVQAGEWLRANPAKSTGAYLSQVENLRQRVDIPGLKTQQDRTTAAVVELTLQGLSRDARALADILAWFAPDQLSEALISNVPQVPWRVRIRHDSFRYIPYRIWGLAGDASRRQAAFAELRQVALLEDVEGAAGVYRMHRAFQVVIRAQVAVERKAGFAKARAASAVLAAQFPYDSDFVVHWPKCRILVPHVQALWAEAEPQWSKSWNRPDWAAMDYLLSQAGLFLSKQADLAGAIQLKRAALELKEARLGEEHRDIPLALGNLALDLAKVGALAEAQEKIDRAVALDEEYRIGDARSDLAGTYMQQAGVAIRRIEAGGEVSIGAEAQAENALEKARVIREELFGAESAEMSNYWNSTGYFHSKLGRKWDALSAYEKAYEITQKLPDADEAVFSIGATNYGSTALKLGQAEKALAPLQEAYTLAAKVYSATPNHGNFVQSQKWLAVCQLVLARKGQPEMRAAAEALCARHGLDFAEREAHAASLPLESLTPDPSDPTP